MTWARHTPARLIRLGFGIASFGMARFSRAVRGRSFPAMSLITLRSSESMSLVSRMGVNQCFNDAENDEWRGLLCDINGGVHCRNQLFFLEVVSRQFISKLSTKNHARLLVSVGLPICLVTSAWSEVREPRVPFEILILFATTYF